MGNRTGSDQRPSFISLQQRFRWNELAKDQESVIDLIWIENFHLFMGQHQHHAELDPSPGNQPDIKLPKEAPSRAYLKIAEAIHRFKPKHQRGDTALEVGCSPGGATFAMISLGMNVTGIDPKFMDKRIQTNPHFKHIQKTAKTVTATELIHENPDWIVMDMNIAPLEAIDELAHILTCLKKNSGNRMNLKYGFLTLKLNDWKFVGQIPLYLKRLKECGFKEIQAMQLMTNRQEFFVFASY